MSFFAERSVETPTHSIWNERYRPDTLESYIGNESLKEHIEKCISENDIPHFLFFGRAGVGKTTLAKLIVKNIDCDYIYINASDENNVDTVRNKIRSFASSASFRPLKLIILDECDYLTGNAQAALRSLMETFSSHTRFILTCNYVEKIIDPIRSRCTEYALHPPSRKDAAMHLASLLTNEGVVFDVEDLKLVVDSSYPDIRRMINSAQKQSKGGKLVVDRDEVIGSDYKLQLMEILKSSDTAKVKFKNIRQLIADHKVRDFTDCYRYLFDELDEYASGAVAQVILILSEAQYKDTLVVDKEICFSAAIVQILGEIGA